MDGLGQPYGSTLGHGRISHFEQHDDWVYMIGTAATAYPKTLFDRFDRLIHASNRMEVDEGNRRVRVIGKRGEALISFVDPVTLQFHQDSQFDAGAVCWRNGKNFPLPDQWHLKATPPNGVEARFVTVVQVSKPGGTKSVLRPREGGVEVGPWRVWLPSGIRRLKVETR